MYSRLRGAMMDEIVREMNLKADLSINFKHTQDKMRREADIICIEHCLTRFNITT